MKKGRFVEFLCKKWTIAHFFESDKPLCGAQFKKRVSFLKVNPHRFIKTEEGQKPREQGPIFDSRKICPSCWMKCPEPEVLLIQGHLKGR